MEIELGKKYVIKKETPVFSIDLQQNVMFERSVVVEARQTFRNIIFFGPIVDTSMFGPDFVSKTELEFGPDDVEEEYIKKEGYVIAPPIASVVIPFDDVILPSDLINN